MNADTVKAVQDALAPVAQKLGEGAAHLYEIYVRQVYTEGIVTLVVTGLIIILGIIATVALARLAIKDDDDIAGEIAAGVGLATASLLLISFLWTPDATMKLMNPEYYAIERLVNQVRGQ